MNDKLQKGFSIDTVILGKKLTVIKHLGEGGQGDVYEVEFNGEKKALKWYKSGAIIANYDLFKANIIKNINDGAPSDIFLWPIDITIDHNNTFGYIMDLRPDGYYEIGEFMLCTVRFQSYKIIIDAALQLVTAFRLLHNKGLSYQDLNDGNFFINPKNGKVLICDNDNVAPNGTEMGILGKPRYMAPEIVMGRKKPDTLSDRFSMSVILFILFCLNHPLEGKRSVGSSAVLTPNKVKEIYGDDALFIMDKNDKANAPDPKIHKNPLNIWPCFPEYIKEIFYKAFSKDAISGKSRPQELEWIKVLVRFRSSIVKCSCGNEVFVDDYKNCICDSSKCMKSIPPINASLMIDAYPPIPIISGTRIYLCQIQSCDASDALNPVAVVVSKDNGDLGIKNKCKKTWTAQTPSGKEKKLSPDEIMPVKVGISFDALNTTIKIV